MRIAVPAAVLVPLLEGEAECREKGGIRRYRVSGDFLLRLRWRAVHQKLDIPSFGIRRAGRHGLHMGDGAAVPAPDRQVILRHLAAEGMHDPVSFRIGLFRKRDGVFSLGLVVADGRLVDLLPAVCQDSIRRPGARGIGEGVGPCPVLLLRQRHFQGLRRRDVAVVADAVRPLLVIFDGRHHPVIDIASRASLDDGIVVIAGYAEAVRHALHIGGAVELLDLPDEHLRRHIPVLPVVIRFCMKVRGRPEAETALGNGFFQHVDRRAPASPPILVAVEKHQIQVRLSFLIEAGIDQLLDLGRTQLRKVLGRIDAHAVLHAVHPQLPAVLRPDLVGASGRLVVLEDPLMLVAVPVVIPVVYVDRTAVRFCEAVGPAVTSRQHPGLVKIHRAGGRKAGGGRQQSGEHRQAQNRS